MYRLQLLCVYKIYNLIQLYYSITATKSIEKEIEDIRKKISEVMKIQEEIGYLESFLYILYRFSKTFKKQHKFK